LLYQFNNNKTYEIRDTEPIQSLESFF